MPKILELGKYKFYIFFPPKEHPPSHVHIKSPDGELQLWLDSLTVKESRGFTDKEIKIAKELTLNNLDKLREAWILYHG